ncbi:unnamed protein product [Calypogeia fissa]
MATQRGVQVRTIDGQSVVVHVKASDTVQHLKVHLKQLKWPSDAESNLQFHVFLKGGKLDTSTQLGSLGLSDNDFLVLVPYARKNKIKRRKLEAYAATVDPRDSVSQDPMRRDNSSGVAELDGSCFTGQQNEGMKPTEAIWHAIVADLAAANARENDLSEDSPFLKNGELVNRGDANAVEEFGQRSNDQEACHGRRTGKVEFRDINTAGKTSVPVTVTDSVQMKQSKEDHLVTSEVLYEELRKQSQETVAGAMKEQETKSRGRVLPKTNIPALPPVLEKLHRVFISLNAVCGFLQKQHMQPTWQTVKTALQQLCCSEREQVTVQDIHLLALFCPRLVVLSNMTGEGEDSSFFIDLFDPSMLKKQEQLGDANVASATNIEQIGPSDNMPNSVGKRPSDKAIKSSVGRREKAFQKTIKNLVAFLQESGKVTSSGVSDITIEDLKSAAKTTMDKEEKDRSLKSALPRPPRSHKNVTRCKSINDLGALEMMEHLKKGLGSAGQFVHCELIKHRDAAYGELQHTLAPETDTALKNMGIGRFYTHQAQAINAAMSGENVIVATSTASGKSLCYNIPVLEEMYRNQESCALYLFPTKALAQDQLRALLEMSKNTDMATRMGVYDGDTPQDTRLILRDSARLLITNPDMLHISIMPSHRQFSRILSNLRYVVVDEAHAYRGVFGCHTALIMRRLRRICHYLYGTEPTFIVCSATVANPSDHAQELLGLRKIEVVQNDGSPCGDKFFIFWNPPMHFAPTGQKQKDKRNTKVDTGEASRVVLKHASPIVEVATLFAETVQHNLRCIAFCKSRKLCELVYNYTREILKETAPELVSAIRSYRGGYTASERRVIESDLFAGKLRGVAATNALELGVDIGSLDATLHLGFPGTVASLWQQSGRAVDAHNQQVLEQHLQCAAVEYPLHSGHDDEYFGSSLQTAIKQLVTQGRLGRHPSNGPQDESWNYIGQEKFPSQGVSIRAIDTEKYKIIDLGTNEIIEEVEESKAFFQVYEGAVYMNQGKKYLVKTLDLAAKVALCQEADLKYYTKTRDFTDVHVTGGELAYPRNISENKYRSTTASASTCKVTTHWIGYRRIWHGTNEQFDSVDLFLPDISFDSQAAWIRVPPQIRAVLAAKELSFRAGLHAANHALLNVMSLYIMCNPSDLGSECANPMDTRYFPERLLVFDRHPGGIGIAAQARPMFAELLQAAAELLSACECSTDDGCPCCVQTLDCSEYNEVINKRAAKIIIGGVIQAEDTYRATREGAPPSADGFLKPQIS